MNNNVRIVQKMLRLAIVKYNQKLAIFSVFYLLKLHDIQTQLYLISPHHTQLYVVILQADHDTPIIDQPD